VLKAVVFSASFALVSPLVVLSWVEKRTTGSEVLFELCAQFLALWPGFPGRYLRGAYYFGTLDWCSWETHVGFGSTFTHRGGSMGQRASMGSYCVIGHARIGGDVMMGSRVSIPSGRRQHVDDAGRLTSGTRYDMVIVGDHTWVGEGAIIMANIGRQCIVSAGAVVVKEMPDHCIIGGNPAKVIKELS
jgi:carbonic anhydrase/acetyltransferase-like protein (isoleucine patch superfamily)